MFIHRAKIQLNPNSFIEFSRKIESEIMPALHLQKDFCSGVTSIDTQWLTAIEDTRWKTKQAAEDYQRNGYLLVKKIIAKIAVAEPVTSIFEEPKSVFIQTSNFPETKELTD